MALSAATRPHFTTIASFISTMDKEIAPLFTKILSVCYANNVIGKNIIAIDGCTISLSCSKEWSGTKKELLRKAGEIEEGIRYLVTKHKEADKNTYNNSQVSKEKESIKKLKARAEKIYSWLDSHDKSWAMLPFAPSLPLVIYVITGLVRFHDHGLYGTVKIVAFNETVYRFTVYPFS